MLLKARQIQEPELQHNAAQNDEDAITLPRHDFPNGVLFW